MIAKPARMPRIQKREGADRSAAAKRAGGHYKSRLSGFAGRAGKGWRHVRSRLCSTDGAARATRAAVSEHQAARVRRQNTQRTAWVHCASSGSARCMGCAGHACLLSNMDAACRAYRPASRMEAAHVAWHAKKCMRQARQSRVCTPGYLLCAKPAHWQAGALAHSLATRQKGAVFSPANPCRLGRLRFRSVRSCSRRGLAQRRSPLCRLLPARPRG